MSNGDVHGEVGAMRFGFLGALVTNGESSSSLFLLEPRERSSGPLVMVNEESLPADELADLLRFSTGDRFSSERFLVLKSRTEAVSLLLVAPSSGDLSGGLAGVTGNNKGGEEDDEMSGEDAVGTIVANRGGTG